MSRKKTHEEFEKEAYEVNPNIKILSKYVNAGTHIEAECLLDGHIWNITPHNLLRGRGCPKCSNSILVTQEMFVDKVRNINSNIEVIGNYINNHTKIGFKCCIDGYEWSTTPANVLSGCGCLVCSGRVRRTHELFEKEVYSKRNDLILLSKFTRTNDKIKCQCKQCFHIWEPIAFNILKGHGCPKCANDNNASARILDFNIIKNEFTVRDIELLTTEDEYCGVSKTILRYLCPKHGEQTVMWNNFIYEEAGCKYCGRESGKILKRTPFYKINIAFIENGYTLLSKESEYKTQNTKLRFLCPVHGEQTTTWATFSKSYSCAECSRKRTESKLATKLKEYCKQEYPDTEIEYKIFKNPETGRWLPYDIYIPSLNVFVEVQGRQHFYGHNSKYNSDPIELEKQLKRDELKELYAWQNGRYVEIDTRAIKTVEDAINLIKYGRSETANLAGLLTWTDEIKAKTPMPKYK